MDAEVPIACSLEAGDYRERLDEIRAISRQGLISAERPGDVARLVFADEPRTRSRLLAVVAAEASCCPFLDLAMDSTPEGISLTIAGPPEAIPIVADLAASFEGVNT